MHSSVRKVILNALESYKGDAQRRCETNYERAKMSFGGKTPAELQHLYGHSGETCQQVLENYKNFADLVDEAIEWVNGEPWTT